MNQTRVLTPDGKISEEIYDVITEKPDNRGLVELSLDGKKIKFNKRRTVPVDAPRDLAYVIEIVEKYRAACPHCPFATEIDPSDEFLTCPTHGQVKLFWKQSIRPVSRVQTKRKQTMTIEQSMTAVEDKAKKVDFEQFKGNGVVVEVYTKTVRFDHATIDVRSHTVIIFDGEASRKMCFNTYDGAVGKKGKELPIAAFLANTATESKQWYPVADPAKAVEALKKSNYELTHRFE